MQWQSGWPQSSVDAQNEKSRANFLVFRSTLSPDGKLSSQLSHASVVLLQCGLEFLKGLLPIRSALGCSFGTEFPDLIFQSAIHGPRATRIS
jgi:hypothetical protein